MYKDEMIQLHQFLVYILKYLAENVNRVVTRENLISALSPFISIEQSAINVHMLNLRRKIGDNYIITVRGLGYKLIIPDEIYS